MYLYAAALPARSGPFDWLVPTSMEGPDTLEVAEVHPYIKSFSDDIFFRHKAPITRVHGVVAVITHHEIVALRHLAAHALDGVIAVVIAGESIGTRDKSRALLVVEEAVALGAEFFFVLLEVAHSVFIKKLRH